MPSGMENLDNSRFILRYEHPWGGVASNAAPEDIAPNQLVSSDGLFIRDGCLCSTNFYNFDSAYYRHSLDNVNSFMHNVAPIQAVYIVSGRLVAIDLNCQGYVYNFGANQWQKDLNLGVSYVPIHSCSVMIGGVIYIFDYPKGAEYVYKPGQSFLVGIQAGGGQQFFVGGKYCMTVDRYLITCYYNMPSDAQAIYPNGYAWSGPSKYTTFDPTQDTTRTEGWNMLAEVQQEITGCFAMGNVGYILHDQGLTQLTPTGIGNLPFDSTLLWGGKDGSGCVYPDSLAVFGYIAIWANANDIYMFMASSAPQSITGSARKAIYQDLNKYKVTDNKYTSVSGSIIDVGVDNLSPEMVYNLYIVYTYSGTTTMIVWSFMLSTQTWTRVVINVSSMMQQITGNLNYAGTPVTGPVGQKNIVASSFRFPGITGSGLTFYASSIYGGVIFNVADATTAQNFTDSFFLFQYINTGLSTITDVPPTTNLIFRAEEFQIYRQPTIRGVILRAFGTNTGTGTGKSTLHINVGNQSFSDISVNPTTGTSLYRSYGVYTGIAPQISITSTDFNGYITKVHAFGTYAEGEPI